MTAQEHHILPDKLPGAQAKAMQRGWHGIWPAAKVTDAGGRSTGVAVLARKHVVVTAAPETEGGVIAPSRLMAAKLLWGPAG
eukprot:1916634-Pyramimonas_sp.AAC.1